MVNLPVSSSSDLASRRIAINIAHKLASNLQRTNSRRYLHTSGKKSENDGRASPLPQPSNSVISPPPPILREFRKLNEHQNPNDLHQRNFRVIEIPTITVILIGVLGLLWFFTNKHTLAENEISYREFVENYLIPDKVHSLHVINGTFVKVILKSEKLSNVNENDPAPLILNCSDRLLPTSNITKLHNSTEIDGNTNDFFNASAVMDTIWNETIKIFRTTWLEKKETLEVKTNNYPDLTSMSCREPSQSQPPNSSIMKQESIRKKGVATRISKLQDAGYLKLRKLLKIPSADGTVSFRVGDIARLESLLLSSLQGVETQTWLQNILGGDYSFLSRQSVAPRHSKLPPLYYTEMVDHISLLRAHIPTLLFTAVSLITLSNRPPATGFNRHNIADGLPRPPMNYPMSNQSQDRILKFGKASPKTGLDIPKISFDHVAGLEQAKKEVSEFVEFLKNPKQFTDLGAEIPKGALLVGPPGTGKTLLARAVAGEASVPFFSMSGSDFIEMFVGVGPSRIRDLFNKARQNAPAIVFIDEIDTIGRSRAGPGMPGGSGSDERESTLNALLVELDGFSTSQAGVIILAGTNRGDVLDPALTRPGRFDRRIHLAKPSINDRKAIFDIHLAPIKLDPRQKSGELSKRLAALTPGFSGAEIKSVCNEAAIIAARNTSSHVGLLDLEAAVDRLIGGLKETGDILTSEMRDRVALHEAGHAVAGWFLPGADPVLKLSIVPRANGSLGFTQMLPDEVMLATKEDVLARICVLLGGRASEALYCGSISTGASDDLDRATRLARACVCQLGFEPALGLRAYPPRRMEDPGGFHREYSEATAQQIDEYVAKLLTDEYQRVLNLLRKHEREVRAVAQLLAEREVVSYADLKGLIGPSPGELKSSVRRFVEALPSDECLEDEDDEILIITEIEGEIKFEDALINGPIDRSGQKKST